MRAVFRVLSPNVVPSIRTDQMLGETVGAPPHWMTVLLVCLATYRLTRFITKDAFPPIAAPRRWIDKHWNPFPDQGTWDSYRKAPTAAKRIVMDNLKEHSIKSRPTGLKRSIAYLVGCAWCTSIWVAALVVSFTVFYNVTSWQWGVALWLTASAVTGLISQREPE